MGVGTSLAAERRKMKNLSNDDRVELLGQLIDIVEDYIAERKGTNEPCNLGDDYDKLSSEFEETLVNWGLLKKA